LARIAATFVLLVSLVGCGRASPNASPTAAPAAAAVASSQPTPSLATMPTAARTVTPGPTVVPTPTAGGCPTDDPITPTAFMEAPEACFGSEDVRILGWLDTPPPFGYEAPEVKPNWLYYPPDGTLYFTLFGSEPGDADHVCADCPGMFVHLTPDSNVVLEGPARWVVATGHRNDPAAERCHFVAPPDIHIGELPDEAIAVEACRQMFVLTSIVDAFSP
jgi:hypothetical protein